MPSSMAATKTAAFASREPRDTSAGPGQKPASPADAEDEAAADETPVDVAPLRQMQRAAEERARAPAGEAESEEADEDRSGHDECERGVPAAGEIEKADHFGRVGHA